MTDLSLDLPPQYLQSLQQILQQQVPDCAVWAYGSRVFGRNHDASDLDLVVCNAASADQPVSHIHDLQQAIGDSNLPILVQVLDWACIPDDFKAEIQRGFVVIQHPIGEEEQHELKNES